MTVRLGLLFTFLLCSQLAVAGLRLPHFFSDHMIVQQDHPAVFWGWADPGSEVDVRMGTDNIRARTARDGLWRVELPAQHVGGPYEVTISCGPDRIVLQDVLVGDVWLCSGQSNMEFTVRQAYHAEAEIARSENPLLRFLNIPKAACVTPQENIGSGNWSKCGPETTGDFSAVGYYFGRELASETHIPIGLINASWGGTDIRAWTSWETLVERPELSVYSDVAAYATDVRNSERQFWEAVNNDPALREGWYRTDFDTEDWDTVEIPYGPGNLLDKEDGIVWYRTVFVLPENFSATDVTLRLGPIDDEDITYINGEEVGRTNDWSRGRYYKVAPGILRPGSNQLVVRCKDTNGGGGPGGSAADYRLEADGRVYPLAGMWRWKASAITSMFGCRLVAECNIPSVLYNGMVRPYAGLPIKGVIWYQGETNAAEAYAYRSLFPALIRDWRNIWGYDFPFLWVQLANYKAVKAEPSESDWAELREAQNRTLALPATGQAVITDIGDADDIHPRNKQDVGYRLARAALRVAYGRNVQGEGPVYKSMKIRGKRIVLKFGSVGRGLRTRRGDKTVRGFAVAGEDRRFVWASARIRGRRHVEVWNENLKSPVAVRYGWADNPADADLENTSSLLASPFRTDDWPGITE